MKKRLVSLLMAICMVASVVPDFVLPVFAQTTSKDDWGHNITGNLIPELKKDDTLTSVGWNNIGDQITSKAWETERDEFTNKFVIRARNTSHDIGNKGYTGGVFWRIDFSAEDQVKINKGDLELSSSARFWIQGLSAEHNISIRFEFFNAQGVTTGNDKATQEPAKATSDRTVSLSLNYVKIPQNTAYVQIWFSNWGNYAGRPYIGDFEAHLIDWVAPKAIEDVHEYAVNGNTTLPEYVVPGDIVTYAVRFDEAVTVNNSVSIKLSNGISVTTKDFEYSADRQTVYANVEMTNKSWQSVDLRLTDIYFTLMDDAERLSLYTKSDISVGSLQYKSKFNVTSSLTNLNSSGTSTAYFGNNYTATLTPKAGYKLPDNITVKVSGKTVTDYTYSSSTGRIVINSAVINGDIEIIANAQLQTYTVTFNKQSGSGGTGSVQATYTQAMPSITPPTRSGYAFGGYYDATNGTGTQYYDFNGNPVRNFDKTANTTLYAKWTPKQYTVTLNPDGGSGGQTITAEYDAAMPTINKPTRKGYTFRGYFTRQNGNGTKYYNADGTSARKYDKTDGLTLYAAWSANSYTVTFDKQGGSGGSDSTTATYDSAMPKITPPTRPGYSFQGYHAGKGATGTQYYESTGSGMRNYDIAGDATLYASWTAKNYDVVLNAQGGSGGQTITATYGNNMPPITAPDKPGYNFGGYYSQPNGGGELFYRADCTSAMTYNKDGGITLYAKWTPITYNIQLYSRGEYVKRIDNVTYGQLNLPSAEDVGIIYPNYKFVGWNIYDEQNWAMYTAGRTYSTGLVTEQGKTAYLYAAWLEKDKYTVTYDANGGEGAPSAVEVHVDEVISLSTATPSRQDYTFLGWSDESGATAAKYQPGDSFTMGNSIVTLFAVWSKNPELTYNANGGVFTSFAAAAYPPAGSKVTLTSAVPQKEGYTFRGWAESAEATVSDIVASPYTMPNHDTVLYAVYEPIKYTVTVDAATGYTVSGIAAGGYVFGDYAEFTVDGSAPKVYINGVIVQPLGGVYRFEVTKNSSVVVSDASMINVIYNANGGTDAPIDNKGYSNGDYAEVKSGEPTRVGYKFSGWATTPYASAKDYNAGALIPAIADDIILYAVWEPTKYTIKYDANGGSGTMSDTAAVYDEMTALAKNAFEKTGSQFVGWAYTADGEVAYADGASVKNLTDTDGGEVVLYAVWRGAKTKINFRFEGGTSGTASIEASYGKPLTADNLIAPTRHGYTFGGYYTAPNKGGNMVYNANMIPADTNPWSSVAAEIDLYAAWEPIAYKVAFVNGTETIDTMTAVFGTPFRLPTAESLGITVSEGWSFLGWSVASGSDAVYYTDGQEIVTGLADNDGDTVYLYAVVRKNVSYTIKYDKNTTEDILVPGAQTKIHGEVLTLSAQVPTRTGYTFEKWNTAADGSGTSYYAGGEMSANADVTLYAQWKINRYPVTLITGEGVTGSLSANEVEHNGTVIVTAVSGSGYGDPTITAIPSENAKLIGNGEYKITGAVSFVASATARATYTARFYLDGGLYYVQSAIEGSADKITLPNPPSKQGYTFVGWFTAQTGGNQVDENTALDKDMSVYAQFEVNKYTVTLPSGRSEFSVNATSSTTVEHGGNFTFSITVADGYNAADMTVYANGILLEKVGENGNTVDFEIKNITAETVVTVRGIGRNTYSVTFVNNGNIYSVGTVDEGEKITKPSDPKNEGKIFGGWYVDEECTQEYDFNNAVSGDVRLYAKWTSGVYTVKYDGNTTDSVTVPSAQTKEHGKVLTLSAQIPTRVGYTFEKWNTAADGSGTSYYAGGEMSANADVTLYAQWKINKYPVTLITGEGVTGSLSANEVEHNGTVTVTTVSGSGYGDPTITAIPSENAEKISEGVYRVKGAVSFVASATARATYTARFYLDGGLYYVQSAIEGSADKITLPNPPAKQGYTFVGWFTAQTGGDRVDENTALDKDISVYAQFEINKYTVTLPGGRSEFSVNATSSTTVEHGGNFTFSITVADGYNAADMTVYANGILLEKVGENGNTVDFEIENITAETVVTVRGIGRNTYSVTFINGGNIYSVGTVDEGDKITKPSDPKNEGKIFGGWYTDEECTQEYDFNSAVSGDVRLYAKWTSGVYTIKYDGNTMDSVTVPSAQTKEHGKVLTLSAQIPTRVGYTFEKWNTEADGSGTSYYAGGEMSANADVILYAQWKINRYPVTLITGEGVTATISANEVEHNGTVTVTAVSGSGYGDPTITAIPSENAEKISEGVYRVKGAVSFVASATARATYTAKFYLDGGLYYVQSAIEGSADKITLPNPPAKQGYTFVGWFTAQTGGDRVDENTALDKDISVYAQFEVNKYSVTLPSGRSEFSVNATSSTTVEHGGNFTFSITVADGYNAADMTVYANGILVEKVSESGNTVNFEIKNITSETVVTVRGIGKNTYSVTFVNGGNIYSVGTVDEGDKITKPTDPKNEGKIFGGWFTDEECTQEYDFNTAVSGDVRLYAKWTSGVYTIKYDGNTTDSVTVPSAQTKEHGKVLTLSAQIPTRVGYTFEKWNTEADGSGTSYYAGGEMSANADVTLYAQWKINKYPVTLITGEGVTATISANEVEHNGTVTVTAVSGSGYGDPTITAIPSENAKLIGNGEYKITGAVSFVASATARATYTAKFYLDGGLYYVQSAIEGSADKITLPNPPSKQGYTFVGWFTAQTGGNQVDENTALDSDMSVYAQFKINKYTVTLPSGRSEFTVTPTSTTTVEHGGSFTFSITVADGYNAADMTVYANGILLEKIGENGNTVDFEIENITAETVVTVRGIGKNTYSVTFINGGNIYSVGTVDEGDKITKPSDPKNEGKIFGGWYTDEECTQEYDFNTAVSGDVRLYAKWTSGVYTVKYDGNTTDSVTVPSAQTKEHGKVLTLSAQIPTRVGYTFEKWNTAADGSGTSYYAGGEMSANADVTLYAQWKINRYPVTLITGEGVTATISANEVEHNGTVTVTAVSGSGYGDPTITAIPSENAKLIGNGEYKITGAVSFVASAMARATYTARFYLDGGLYYVQSAIEGSADKIALPNPPSKQGYTFVGWFTAQTGGDQVDENTVLDSDMSVYARFEVNKYTVTLPRERSEFSVNATSSTTVEHGGNFTFSITVADGYNAADMTVYANGVLLEKVGENGNTVDFEIENITAETVVTVRGIGRNTYSVTYDPNTTEYVGNMPENLTKVHDDDVSISDRIPERHGYDFVGWADSADGDAGYFGGDVYSDNADIRLYAVWKAKTFAVSFETNGGIINGGEITEYTYGKGAVLPTDVSKSGYTFAGWYEDEYLQGVRVFEIKESDFGDKKYYAAYTMASVVPNDYSGEYDGKAHEISYTINDDLTVENYQWYFVPAGASEATAVASDSYNKYEVKGTAQSGEYYCYVEALQGGYVIRFFTERATVAISKKPVTVKAADGAKVYDAQPLATNETELTGEGGLVDGHKITAAMTAQSSITNVGTAENRIEQLVISDGDGKDVTENYEVTTRVGTLNITPLNLTVEPQKVSVSAWIVLSESSLYKIVGKLGDEVLTLANASFTAKDADGKEISLSDITKTAGTYTVTIVYDGFAGEGSGNYSGSGTVTSEVTVYKKSSGGGGSGGGSSAPTAFTVSFESNGGSAVDSQSVKKGGSASEPKAPQREGYTFDGWYSDSGLTAKYDFAAKVTKDITLYAKWTAAEPDEEQKDDNPSVADPTKTGVAKLLETEEHIAYLKGNTDGTFKPDSNMTRAEAAQMFYNLLIDKDASVKGEFDDVGADAWYHDAVAALGGMGIINGVGAGRFNPNGEISRAEFVTMAMRFVDADVNGEKNFADVPQSHWAAGDISAAATLGWISGNDNGTFGPDDSVSRACVAKIVNNMLGRKADIEYIGKNKESLKILGDVSEDAWYFGDVAEATNAHDYAKSADDGAEIWK